MARYRTSPVASTRMPGGIPYIISNEAAERFSFYGMRGILVVFMTKYLVDQTGQQAVMGEEDQIASTPPRRAYEHTRHPCRHRRRRRTG